jgi:hypothetical protein
MWSWTIMFDASILEVFIASTNDLKEEPNTVEEVLRDWNLRNAQTRQIMLEPIRWEEDSTPELGPGSFEAVINQRLLAPAELLVGIVGKRLGFPTETSIAGTVEESSGSPPPKSLSCSTSPTGNSTYRTSIRRN